MSLAENKSELYSGLKIWQEYRSGLQDQPEHEIKPSQSQKFLGLLNTYKNSLLLAVLSVGTTFGLILYAQGEENMKVAEANRFDYEENDFRFKQFCEVNKTPTDYGTHLTVTIKTDPGRIYNRDIVVRWGESSDFFPKARRQFPDTWTVSFAKARGYEIPPGQDLKVEILESDLNNINKNEKFLAAFYLQNPCT